MKKHIIIKLEFANEQTVGQITKIVGLMRAKYLIPIIDSLDLEANPRSSRTGSVTEAIQESIVTDPNVFPFKTKGILLAASQYDKLDRNRFKITPVNTEVEGILDGGHNTLAIGLYILQTSLSHFGHNLKRGSKTWDQFKELWTENRHIIDDYLDVLRSTPEITSFNFLVPVELLVPRDPDDYSSVEAFKGDLLDICAARNNNVQLQVSAKANQLGYFDDLKRLLDEQLPTVSARIEWKTNDGGDIKVQDLVSLAWIPLQRITPVCDESGRTIEPVSPSKIYSSKGTCLKQFEKLMSSPQVTQETSANYKRELSNVEVLSALRIAVQLPALYDYIYAQFPQLYNTAGGKYGNITAVKTLNKNRKQKLTPFLGNPVETLSPEGYIAPLVYGLVALLKNSPQNQYQEITWVEPPMEFLERKLGAIVTNYVGLFGMCDYDPQKIGKNPQSYVQAESAFKMALANLI